MNLKKMTFKDLIKAIIIILGLSITLSIANIPSTSDEMKAREVEATLWAKEQEHQEDGQ